jgi:hypothetical protein
VAATPNVSQLASESPSSGIKPWVGLIFLGGLLAAAALWTGAGRVRGDSPASEPASHNISPDRLREHAGSPAL